MTVQAPHKAEHGAEGLQRGAPHKAEHGGGDEVRCTPHSRTRGGGSRSRLILSSLRAPLFPLLHGHLQYSFIKTKVCFSG